MYDESAVTIQRMQTYVYEWGPRVIAALAILIAAYVLGRVVKWALAKGIDRVPGARHANEGTARHETVGARLGDVGYWLILLVGLILALNALRLTGVVQPLNAMLAEFAAFVPNLVGALMLFFIGFIVATVARRLIVTTLQAADLDRWLDRAGLRRVTGAGGLARALGTLAFVLIIIPFAIAALQQLRVDAISVPAIAMLSTILNAIPRVLGAAVVLALFFAIARWVASLVEQLLPSLGFDNSVRALGSFGGISAPTPTPEAEPIATDASGQTYDTRVLRPSTAAAAGAGRALTPSKVVAQIAFAAVMVFGAVQAAQMLQFAAVSTFLAEVLALGAKVLFGGAIIAAGVILANFVAQALDRSTGGRDGFASDIVKWATIALAVAMGLSFMDVADAIITLAFGLILGSAAVAAALAFGIGGRDQAGRWLERWSSQAQQKQAQAQARKQAQQRQAAQTPPTTTPPAASAQPAPVQTAPVPPRAPASPTTRTRTTPPRSE